MIIALAGRRGAAKVCALSPLTSPPASVAALAEAFVDPSEPSEPYEPSDPRGGPAGALWAL